MNRKGFSEPDRPILGALLEESDRGCVLVAHGHMDVRIEELLRLHFSNIGNNNLRLVNWFFDPRLHGPISNFGVKAKLAYALGLIDDDLLGTLEGFTAIRNHFAHHPGRVSLTVSRVENVRSSLGPILTHIANLVRSLQESNDLEPDPVWDIWKARRHSKARRILTEVIVAVFSGLINAIEEIRIHP